MLLAAAMTKVNENMWHDRIPKSIANKEVEYISILGKGKQHNEISIGDVQSNFQYL